MEGDGRNFRHIELSNTVASSGKFSNSVGDIWLMISAIVYVSIQLLFSTTIANDLLVSVPYNERHFWDENVCCYLIIACI